MMEGNYSFRIFAYFLMLAVCTRDSNAQLKDLFNGSPELVNYVTTGVNENVNVTCLVQVFNFSSFKYVSVETQWQLLPDTMDFLTFSQDTKIAINHSYISVSGNYSQVLVISNFTQEMDRLTIGCRGDIDSDELGMITVGLPVAPTFLQADSYDVVEYETFSINDIRAPSNNPFPPYISGTVWFINNELLSDQPYANIETGEFNITIKSVTRNYSESMFTFQSSDPFHSISFSLNVLYPPKVELYNMSYVYASVGDNVLLNAVFNITGNPTPLSTWRRNGIILSSSDKYSFTIPGQIYVENLSVVDFNLYVFTVGNNIGNDIIVEISLLETEPRFKSAYVNNLENNGGLSLTWNLTHTGYEKNIDRISINATCKNINTTENGLSYYCYSDCIDNNLMGSGYIEGPVYAGVSYQCILTTTNSNGSNLFTTEMIIPINGIPSPPVISLDVDTTGGIIIVVWSKYSGDNSTFLFVVMVTNDDDVIVHNMSYAGLSYRRIVIDAPIAGRYSVNVTSRNKFGISSSKNVDAQIEPNSSSASVKYFAVLITIGVILSALFTLL